MKRNKYSRVLRWIDMPAAAKADEAGYLNDADGEDSVWGWDDRDDRDDPFLRLFFATTLAQLLRPI